MKTLQTNSLPTLNTKRMTTIDAVSRMAGRLGTTQRNIQRMRVWRSNPRCGACGGIVAFEDMELDHIIPLHLGGSNDDSNMQTMHKSCHRVKTNEELRDKAKRQRAGGLYI